MSGARDLLRGVKVMPVVVIHDAEDAAPMAEALQAGGLRAIEITLRTPASLDAIRKAKAAARGMIVGAGTIRRPEDVRLACEAGADFLVSPGLTPAIALALQASGVPALPGTATVSEAMRAQELGFDFLKFFPAEAIGGAPALASFVGPLPDVVFCPTGGIRPETADRYLALPNVAMIGGSWLTPDAAVKTRDWAAIESLARAAPK
jgi:2-dehydro-3-deoxyphosphogluconate aldolase/(4S)-4-hydroxy-2-oxoglutarate aldolase